MPVQTLTPRSLLVIADCPHQRDALCRALADSPCLSIQDSLSIAETILQISQPSRDFSQLDCILYAFPDDSLGDVSRCVELLQQIKAHHTLRGLPTVIFGSAHALNQIAVFPEAHFCHFARRPAQPEQLSQVIHQFGEYWSQVARVSPRMERPLTSARFSEPPVGRFTQDGIAERPVEIWMVDDNEDDAAIFRESLTQCGQIRVTRIFVDSEVALASLRDPTTSENCQIPDLVMLDIHMPRKTGLALLEELKADPALRQFPVVMMTASRCEQDIWESYSRGSCSFIEKPPRFDQIQTLATRFANYWTCVAHLPTRPLE